MQKTIQLIELEIRDEKNTTKAACDVSNSGLVGGWKRKRRANQKFMLSLLVYTVVLNVVIVFFPTISTKSGRLKKKCLMTWQTAPKNLFKYSCGFIQTFRNHALLPWERSKIIILHSPPIYSNSFRLNNLNKRAGHEKFCLDGSVNKKGGCACW